MFMRKQYHLWPADTGFDAWDVDRLIHLSRGLPMHAVAVDSVREVDTVYWFDASTAAPTVRAIVEHARLMLDADLSFPVILGPDGRVMDGMHRIARAMLDGKKSSQRRPLPGTARTGLPGLPARRSPVLTGAPELTRHPAISASSAGPCDRDAAGGRNGRSVRCRLTEVWPQRSSRMSRSGRCCRSDHLRARVPAAGLLRG